MLNPIIYNKDIKELEKKQSISPDELALLKLGKQPLEKKIQEACRIIFESQFDYRGFVSIDNGDTAGGKLLDYQRINLYKNKKKTGTKHGFPDTMLIVKNKIAFVEFKRIGAPSQIDIKQDQLDYQKWLQDMGFKAYITNNPIYFKNVILKELVGCHKLTWLYGIGG